MRNLFGAVVVALALVGPGVSAAKDKPASGAKAPAKEETLSLKKGEQKTLSVPGVTRIAVGDPDIADVETQGDDALLIKGVSAGKTTLLVWTADKQRTSYLVDVK